jgi:hypothetical protein
VVSGKIDADPVNNPDHRLRWTALIKGGYIPEGSAVTHRSQALTALAAARDRRRAELGW